MKEINTKLEKLENARKRADLKAQSFEKMLKTWLQMSNVIFVKMHKQKL